MEMRYYLIIFHTVMNILVCEVIVIKRPMETRNLNASAILDMAILRNATDIVNYTPASKGTSNLTFIPWPVKTLQERRQSSNHDKSASSTNDASPETRTPKSFYGSANLPPKASFGERPIIPAGHWMYPGWNEISLRSNRTTLDMKKTTADDLHNTSFTDVQTQVISSIPPKVCQHRAEKRKDGGTNRQYLANDESAYEADDDYVVPESHYSLSNSDPENTDAYAQKYVGESNRYGSKNYDSYSPESTKYSQHYQSGPDVHSGSAKVSRRPRPSSPYSRFTVESLASYQDPNRSGASPSLTGIFSAIGTNLLQLFKIALGSGLSIALPLIFIKLFLIPLKILKFIKIVKIFLKLVFVVPFILRVFAPSIYHSIGHRNSGFGNQVPISESRHDLELGDENSTWFNDVVINLTSALPDFVSTQKCPSRVACELGSYLARTNNISKKVINFLADDDDDDDEESKDFNDERIEREEVTRAFLRALTQRWTYDRCDVFACGFSL